MAVEHILALVAFIVVVLALSLLLPTSRPKLDGSQKYRTRAAPLLGEDGSHRPSMSPLALMLAGLFGSSVSSHLNDDLGIDFDAGDGGGGGDGGGE